MQSVAKYDISESLFLKEKVMFYILDILWICRFIYSESLDSGHILDLKIIFIMYLGLSGVTSQNGLYTDKVL